MNDQTARRRIGVLGGMGPEATVLFMQRVIAATPARDDCDHVPMLVDNNTQVPSRIKALIDGTGENPGFVLAQMAARLEQAGAEALVMPCNTAHNYTAAIRSAVSIPFLSMIDLAAQEIFDKKGSGARVGILASPAVRITGIFENVLQALSIKAVYPQDEKAMLAAIRALKTTDGQMAALELVLAGAEDVISQGAELLLIGCSEYSLIGDKIAKIHPTIDSLDSLVSGTISFSKQGVREDLFNRKDIYEVQP